MANKKNNTHSAKKQRGNGAEAEKKRPEKEYTWDEDESSMEQGLLVIVLFALGAISLLSFIHAAGDFGEWVDTLLGWLFGWGRYVTPAIFGVLGYIFLHPEKYEIRILNYIGLALFVFSGLALLHLFVPIDNVVNASTAGQGGGFLGIILAYPLIRFTGVWVTIVVLIGLFIASWLIMFNTSLGVLFSRLHVLRLFVAWFAKPALWIKGRVHARVKGYRIEDEEDPEEDEEYEEEVSEDVAEEEDGAHIFSSKEIPENGEEQEMVSEGNAEQMELIPKPPRRRTKRIDLPLNLLVDRNDKPTSGDIETNKATIQKTLENFGIDVEMGDISVGPMVTQYTLKPAEGVKLTQITTLHNDIALALAAHPIRIEAPIPGKALVGIEVPNKTAATVTLRELIASKKFRQQDTDLVLGLGKERVWEELLCGLGNHASFAHCWCYGCG